jgi:hypothetical protein
LVDLVVVDLDLGNVSVDYYLIKFGVNCLGYYRNYSCCWLISFIYPNDPSNMTDDFWFIIFIEYNLNQHS